MLSALILCLVHPGGLPANNISTFVSGLSKTYLQPTWFRLGNRARAGHSTNKRKMQYYDDNCSGSCLATDISAETFSEFFRFRERTRVSLP